MSSTLVVFLLGTLGGALGEVLKWYQLRETKSSNLPEYRSSPLYWIITVLMALAGGVLAWAYGVESAKPLLALNVGITAPLILKALAAFVPVSVGGTPPGAPRDIQTPGGGGGSRPSVIDFIAGR